MRSGSAWLLGLAGVALSNALTLEKRDSPAVLAVPMVRERDTSREIYKRSKTIKIGLEDEDINYAGYRANMTFGTPPQQFIAYFNTWSNVCWLNGVGAGECELYSDDSCGGDGSYNRTASTTAKKLEGKFAYNDTGSMATGDFVTDVLSIGGVKIDDMKMGIITNDDYTGNVLGLGYGNASSTSLTQALADTGAINSPAFSLYNDMVLFGGVNKAQYNGSLHTFPIVNGSDLFKAFRINMDGISINETSAASKEFPLDAVFDIDFGMTYVPKSVAEALNSQIGNTSVADDWGQVNFTCNAISENSTIEFKFGGLELQFPLWEFVSKDRYFQDDYEWTSDNETCYFTICENKDYQDEGSIVLGANFISMIYTVFDIDNDEISLAKLSWDIEAEDDIVEITSGKDGVPGTKKDSGSASPRIGKGLGVITLAVVPAVLILAL
ncbi:hypothetical protein N7478_005994 [Penicillium angulare]|uniref:uncharacterized protein n=1 Tax=Penicillium angulare TaxID=116970 RepID=UPI002541F258|nr:uncharacterized protein N7478_005994 [Penicillium angulare]KAJ5280622.1 hypothetical protein N7478_005994 [Penicillium angulare]